MKVLDWEGHIMEYHGPAILAVEKLYLIPFLTFLQVSKHALLVTIVLPR